MRFEILNVEHGFAAYAQAMDGSVFLFDCGYSWQCRPSEYLWARGIRTIRCLFITNYDEDHIADLPQVRARFNIEILIRNPSLTQEQLRQLKPPPISPAMQSLLEMIDMYTWPLTNELLNPPGLCVQTFYNSYPSFIDTNNLSLLTFLDVGNMSFVIPGDLERPGWLALLENKEVRELLGRVDVFIASHHGRESGYCKEVFNYCEPSLIVISDESIKYATQEMASAYAQHATGQWIETASGREWRKVVSTRKDGIIYWEL